jgi:hypothetical protein
MSVTQLVNKLLSLSNSINNNIDMDSLTSLYDCANLIEIATELHMRIQDYVTENNDDFA